MIAPSVLAEVAPAPLQPGIITTRVATEADDAFVEELQALAFGPGRFARTAFRVRERFPIDTSLSLIAEVDGVPCASVWMTPMSVGGIDGYMLGPLATHPNFRRRGVGKRLALEVTRMALERGEGSFVILIGDRDYYCPLGFQPTTLGAIEWPGPVDPSRVLVYSEDKTLATHLGGKVGAFRARSRQ